MSMPTSEQMVSRYLAQRCFMMQHLATLANKGHLRPCVESVSVIPAFFFVMRKTKMLAVLSIHRP